MGAGDEGSQVIQRRNAGPLGLIGISGVALEVPAEETWALPPCHSLIRFTSLIQRAVPSSALVVNV